MVMNKNYYTSGNTAFAPQVGTQINEYEKIKKQREEKNRLKRKKQSINKVKALRNIALVFILGFSIVYRYSAIYSMQKNLNTLKNNAITLQKENENLRVDTVRSASIEKVEINAVNKLKMEKADKATVVYADLTRNNFAKPSEKEASVASRSIFDKIKAFLF